MTAGLSSREAGWHPSKGARDQVKNTITLENVHNISTYELRHEVNRRGKFLTLDSGNKNNLPLNHQTLLKTMIEILVNEKEHAAETAAAAVELAPDNAPSESASQKMRAERKAAAIERSRQRQALGGYFEAKKAANTKLAEEKSAKVKEAM